MIHRKSAAAKIAIGVFLCLFIAGVALPDVFAAGLGSASQRGGSSSPSSSTDRGGGSPIISDKSSSIPSGSSSIPSGSSIPSTTPMSIPSESKTSYKTYTQPGSVETFTSPEGPAGSVGSEASAPGSKKKKAGGGGFPPVDNTIVTGLPEGDTAMAIRGKPAHPEDVPTKGSEVAEGGSSGGSGGPDLERIGGDILRETQRALNADVHVPGLPETMQPGHLIKEGERSLGAVVDPVGKAIEKTGENIGDTIEKAGRDTIKEAGRLPENIEKGGKALEEQLRYGIGQLREGKIGHVDPVRDTIKEVERVPKNIDRAINEAGRGLKAITPNLPETMQPGHLIKEGERSITGPVGDAIDQTGKNIGDTMEKVGRDVKEQAGRTWHDIDQNEGFMKDAGKVLIQVKEVVMIPVYLAVWVAVDLPNWIGKGVTRVREALGPAVDKGVKDVGRAVDKGIKDTGDEMGRTKDKVTDVLSDIQKEAGRAEDQAGGVLGDAQDAAEGVVSGAQDTAEDQTSEGSTADQICDSIFGNC